MWVRLAAAAWIVGGAFLAVCLLVLRPEKESSALTPVPQEASAKSTTKSASGRSIEAIMATTRVAVPAPDPSVSMSDYFSRLYDLETRFLQRDEFIASLNGREVSWSGSVYDVLQAGSRKVALVIKVEPSSTSSVYAWFEPDFQAKVFSFRRGDIVRVTGTVSLQFPNAPNITATEVEAVNLGK
jgi:hypothetical protein